MNSKFKIFLKGIIDVSPLMIPVVPFGLIFGVLAIDIGFTPLETMGMSLIVFGGASQIVLLQLFSGGASSLVIISSVGAVNSRHLLYGAVVSEHLSDLKLIWKIIISYFLIDQAFAISNEYLKKNKDLGTITGNFVKPFPIGSSVKLLIQPEDLHHDDTSNLKFEVIDRKFRGTNFIYTLSVIVKKFFKNYYINI